MFLAVVSIAGFNARQGDLKRPRGAAGAGSQTTLRAELTTLETRETAQPSARAKLTGRNVQVTGNTRGVGAAIGRSLARQLGLLGWRDGVARVAHCLFADGRSPITGRVWALDGRGAM